MKDKITIVKVIGRGDPAFLAEDIERWSDIFATHKMTPEAAEATGEVKVTYVDKVPEDDNYITLVKIGDESYRPLDSELEIWRNVFEDAKNDPDFTIFTGVSVEITRIKIGNVIKIE